MAIDDCNLRNYVKGHKYDQKLLDQTITELVLLVLKRHYQQYLFDDELQSVGRTKAIFLLNSEHVNSREKLVNFLYTGIRNEIGNTIKREKRGTGLKFDYNDEIVFEDYTTCSGSEDQMALSNIIEHMEPIVENLEDLGFNLEIEGLKKLYELKYEELPEFEAFVVKAAIARSLLR